MKLTSWIPEHWTEEQIKIWRNFEQHWQYLMDGNIKEFIKYIHPQFKGFGHESPLPVDYPWLEKWVGFWAKSNKFLICELRPVNVIIHDDVAILQCIIFTIGQNFKSSVRRYTMTWKKQPDRWVVIGSHNNLISDSQISVNE